MWSIGLHEGECSVEDGRVYLLCEMLRMCCSRGDSDSYLLEEGECVLHGVCLGCMAHVRMAHGNKSSGKVRLYSVDGMMNCSRGDSSLLGEGESRVNGHGVGFDCMVQVRMAHAMHGSQMERMSLFGFLRRDVV